MSQPTESYTYSNENEGLIEIEESSSEEEIDNETFSTDDSSDNESDVEQRTKIIANSQSAKQCPVEFIEMGFYDNTIVRFKPIQKQFPSSYKPGPKNVPENANNFTERDSFMYFFKDLLDHFFEKTKEYAKEKKYKYANSNRIFQPKK